MRKKTCCINWTDLTRLVPVFCMLAVHFPIDSTFDKWQNRFFLSLFLCVKVLAWFYQHSTCMMHNVPIYGNECIVFNSNAIKNFYLFHEIGSVLLSLNIAIFVNLRIEDELHWWNHSVFPSERPEIKDNRIFLENWMKCLGVLKDLRNMVGHCTNNSL